MIKVGAWAACCIRSGWLKWTGVWACSGELGAHSSGTMEHLLAW